MGVPGICHIKCMLRTYATGRDDTVDRCVVRPDPCNVRNAGSRRIFPLLRVFLRQTEGSDVKLLEEQDSKTDHTVDSIGDTGKNVVLTYHEYGLPVDRISHMDDRKRNLVVFHPGIGRTIGDLHFCREQAADIADPGSMQRHIQHSSDARIWISKFRDTGYESLELGHVLPTWNVVEETGRDRKG